MGIKTGKKKQAKQEKGKKTGMEWPEEKANKVGKREKIPIFRCIVSQRLRSPGRKGEHQTKVHAVTVQVGKEKGPKIETSIPNSPGLRFFV